MTERKKMTVKKLNPENPAPQADNRAGMRLFSRLGIYYK
jgi:hypothetical protein